MDDETVSFKWRDYRDGSKLKIMSLKATEFIRRFLLHVLPSGFMRIRHYGLLANRHRRQKLSRCRELLAQNDPPATPAETTEQLMERLTGHDLSVCRHCKKGTLHIVEIIARQRAPPP